MRHQLSFLLFLLTLGHTTLHAQEIRTNDRGEKIIVYPDGSWKYYDEASVTEPDPTVGMSTEEREEYLEDEARKDAIRTAERARAEANRLEREFREARINRLLAERELEGLDGSSPAETEEATARVVQLAEKQTLAEDKWEAASEFADDLSELIYTSRAKRDKRMEKLLIKRQQWLARNDPDYQDTVVDVGTPIFNPVPTAVNGIEPETPSEPAPAAPRRPVGNRKYATYQPVNDIIINPPASNCTLRVDQTDEFTGIHRKETTPALLFSHTNKELRDLFTGEDDYITAYGHLIQIDGGTRILVIDYYIASQTADRAFGALRPNATVTLGFLNGDTFKLFNNKYDAGKYDPVTGKYHFRGQYSVSGKVEKMVTKSELDQVRVVWETGYEDYPVYELDFFREQFACLSGE